MVVYACKLGTQEAEGGELKFQVNLIFKTLCLKSMDFILYCYLCGFCLLVCLCIPCMPCTCRGQKMLSGELELEL